jgi:hypothetical protein
MLNRPVWSATFFVIALGGCAGDKEGNGGSATTGYILDEDVAPPLIIDEIHQAVLEDSITCAGTSVSIALGFFGDASGGMIDAMETANVMPWND